MAQSGIRQEQASKDQHVDDRRSNVRRTGNIGATEALCRRPDHDGQEDANDICEITESANDQGDRYSGFANRHEVGKDMRVHLHDVDPEVNPSLDSARLSIQGAGEVARKVVDEVRLPLEPGINGPHQPKDDA
jgi:hypothetical protein